MLWMKKKRLRRINYKESSQAIKTLRKKFKDVAGFNLPN
jgi:hypothetical protein